MVEVPPSGTARVRSMVGQQRFTTTSSAGASFFVSPPPIAIASATAARPRLARMAKVEAAKRYHQWWNDDWMAPDSQREREEVITIFGRDGSMTSIPPFVPCYGVCDSENQWENPLQTGGQAAGPAGLPSVEEQGICVGSVFSISATNGYDVSRRIHVSGFCQSIDFLYEQVEGSVRVRGGEIMNVKRELSGSDMLCESLTLALALPLLWHIPPEHEKLKKGIERGGGIIHKIYKEWFIL